MRRREQKRPHDATTKGHGHRSIEWKPRAPTMGPMESASELAMSVNTNLQKQKQKQKLKQKHARTHFQTSETTTVHYSYPNTGHNERKGGRSRG